MVSFELKGAALAVVRLDRPQRMNALAGLMLDGLCEAFARVELEADVRACVLTGERAFCAGMEGDELALLDEVAARDAARRWRELCERIEHCRVPVIAAVN